MRADVRRVLAQTRFETVTVLRNGEQLLLALILPLIILVGLGTTDVLASVGSLPAGASQIQVATAGVLGVAVASIAFTGQGIQTAFDRRYGVLRQLATTPLGAGGIIWGKLGAVLAVLVVLLATTAVVLGLDTAPVSIAGTGLALLAGAAALVSWGVLMAGTLRPEATLAVANLLWVLMASVGGLLFPREGLWGEIAGLTPPGALGDALRSAIVDGTVAWMPLLVLLVWAGAGSVLARRWFSFD
jgi:ABC-2 type transport system permease protein